MGVGAGIFTGPSQARALAPSRAGLARAANHPEPDHPPAHRQGLPHPL